MSITVFGKHTKPQSSSEPAPVDEAEPSPLSMADGHDLHNSAQGIIDTIFQQVGGTYGNSCAHVLWLIVVVVIHHTALSFIEPEPSTLTIACLDVDEAASSLPSLADSQDLSHSAEGNTMD